jgi:hypothetical protein
MRVFIRGGLDRYGETPLSAQEHLEKAQHFLQLAKECSDEVKGRALRALALSHLEKAKELDTTSRTANAKPSAS